MAITKEYLDSISFDIAKQKYYNANKVDAVLDEFKAGVMELISENEKLRKGAAEKKNEPAVDTSALLTEAKIQAESIVGDAKLKAETILAKAKAEADVIIEKAKADAEAMAISTAGSTGLSAHQLDAIDKINKQLDELNVTQATQIFRLKQALVTMATTK